MTDNVLNKIIAHTDVSKIGHRVIHAGQSIDISSAANGKLSTILSKQQLTLSWNFLMTQSLGLTAFNSKDWIN
jgi:hypothetical protein